MTKKGKGTLLICVLAVILLSIFRHSEKFWPLILLDMGLRIPGDMILKAIRPNISQVAGELLRSFFQVGTVLLVIWGFNKFLPRVRSFAATKRGAVRREKALAPPEPAKPEQRRRPTRRLPLVVYVMLAIIVLNGRCGRELVSLASWVTGVDGYPLKVATVISVEEPQEEHVVPGKPCFLFLFEDPSWLAEHGDSAGLIRNAVSSSGGGSGYFKIESSRGKRQTNSLWFKGGTEKVNIWRNLDAFIDKAGGGWWRELSEGFVIYVGKSSSETLPLKGLHAVFPPSKILADDLDSARRFLEELSGVKISMEAAPRGAAPREGGGWRQEDRAFEVEIPRECSMEEFVEAIAMTVQLRAEVREGGIVVRGLRDEEIGSRIRQLFDDYASRTAKRYPESTVKFFPPGSATFIVGYLSEADASIIGYAIDALWQADINPVRTELREMLMSGRTKADARMSDHVIEKLAGLLALSGDRESFDHYDRNYKINREVVRGWHMRTSRTEPTWESVDIQDSLIARFRNPLPLVRPGNVAFGSIPRGAPVHEAWLVERRALDFLNAFWDWSWDEMAQASLVISRDGVRATYRIEISHHWGPLAAGGSSYIVEMKRVDDRWLVTRADRGGWWIS